MKNKVLLFSFFLTISSFVFSQNEKQTIEIVKKYDVKKIKDKILETQKREEKENATKMRRKQLRREQNIGRKSDEKI